MNKGWLARLRGQLEQKRNRRAPGRNCRLHQKHRQIAAVPAWTFSSSAKTISACPWAFTKKYEFPHMYTSPELNAATQSLVNAAKKNNIILGLFLFGTARVGEISRQRIHLHQHRNDLHHVLTQAGTYVVDVERIAKKKANPGLAARHHFFNCRFGAPILVNARPTF